MKYKIIIPKDEPKQEYCNNCNNDICCCIIRKQETLEEAKNNAWYNYEHVEGNLYSTSFKNGFDEGAKWQARRMYTEAELYELTLKALDLGMKIRQDQLNGSCDKSGKELHKEWFEQHKKQTL